MGSKELLELIEGATPVDFGYVQPETFEKQFNDENLRYVYGYTTVYSNGVSVIINGGNCSGRDCMDVWAMDEDGKILYHEET